MALAEIESILLDQWRRLGGSNSIRFGSKTSPEEIAAEADWDLILWAGGRRSLDDATRAEMSCDLHVGESEEVLVFEMRNFTRGKSAASVKIQELEQLAAVDLTFCARSAGAATGACGEQCSPSSLSYRIVLRVAQDAATTPPKPLCWLWFMGLPEELKASQREAWPREAKTPAKASWQRWKTSSLALAFLLTGRVGSLRSWPQQPLCRRSS